MANNNNNKSLNAVQGVLRFPLLRGTENVPFVEIEIHQQSYRHNTFKVTVKHHVLDTAGWMAEPSATLDFLNTLMVMRLFHATTPDDVVYHAAMVTHVEFENKNGKEGDIVLWGISPSVLLDRGEHMEAYHNQSWEQLFDRLKTGIPDNLLDVKLSPVNGDEPSEFLLQYNEEGFAFLARSASVSGEWLFHDGVSLCLGRTGKMKEPVTLTYDVDLCSMSVKAQRVPHKISRYSYDMLNHADLTSEGKDPEAADIASTAWQRSAANLNKGAKETVRHSTIPSVTQDMIDKATNIELSGKVSASVIVTGEALTCKVRLGQTVRIEVPQNFKSAQKALGRYVVVQADHYISQRGEYSCHFTAVAENGDTFYPPELQQPHVQPLIGTVCDTADPKNIGRVQVKLQGIANWGISSGAWFRVMTPDAGSSEAVAKNRGFVFIPEKGDQVVVGFLNGDTSSPFVMGSLFHGKNAEGGASENNVKSIKTKSGHTIELNDDEKGEWGITIKDNNGNSIQLDTKGKNINISAPENMTLTAKNIDIQTEKFNLFAKTEISALSQKLMLKGKDKLSLSSLNLDISGSETLRTYGKTNKVLGKTNIDLAAPKINSKASGYTQPENYNTNEQKQAKSNTISANNVSSSSASGQTKQSQADKTKEEKKIIAQMDQLKKDFYQDYSNWLQELINTLMEWDSYMKSTDNSSKVTLQKTTTMFLTLFKASGVVRFVSDVIFIIGDKIADWINSQGKISYGQFFSGVKSILTNIKNGVKTGDTSTSMINIREREDLFDNFLQYCQERKASKPEEYTKYLDPFFQTVRARYSDTSFFRTLTETWILASEDSWDSDGYAGVLEIFLTVTDSLTHNNLVYSRSEFYIDDLTREDGVLAALKSPHYNNGDYNALNLHIPVRLRIVVGNTNRNHRYSLLDYCEVRYKRSTDFKDWTYTYGDKRIFDDFFNNAKHKEKWEDILVTKYLKKD